MSAEPVVGGEHSFLYRFGREPAADGGVGVEYRHKISLDKLLADSLVQSFIIEVDAKDLIPRVSIDLIPGAFNVLIENGIVSLREITEHRTRQFTLDGVGHSYVPLPFPITNDELLQSVAEFRAERKDKPVELQIPTHIHIPDEMWRVCKPRWGGTEKPFKLLGMTPVWGAEKYFLELKA